MFTGPLVLWFKKKEREKIIFSIFVVGVVVVFVVVGAHCMISTFVNEEQYLYAALSILLTTKSYVVLMILLYFWQTQVLTIL